MRKAYIIFSKGEYYPASMREVKDFIKKTDFDKKEKRELIGAVKSGMMVNFAKSEKKKQKGDALIKIFKFKI